MTYGDKLFRDEVEHIENAAGDAFCGYPNKGYYIERTPGPIVCKSCELIYERETTMPQRWELGLGLEGSKPIRDDTIRVGGTDNYRPPVGLGMFKSDTELTGLEIKPKRKR